MLRTVRLSLIVALATAFGLAACSSKSASTTDANKSEPTPTEQADSGTPSTPDTTTDGGAEAGPTCAPDVSDFKPLTDKPAAASQAACTDDELAQLYKDCAETPDNWESDACAKHTSACAKCMLTKEADATWGAFVVHEEKDDQGNVFTGYTPNITGCIDLVTGKAGCGSQARDFQDCYEGACSDEACSAPGSLDDCQKRAAVNQCKKYAPPQDCSNAVQSDTVKPCFEEAREQLFKNLMKLFCQKK